MVYWLAGADPAAVNDVSQSQPRKAPTLWDDGVATSVVGSKHGSPNSMPRSASHTTRERVLLLFPAPASYPDAGTKTHRIHDYAHSDRSENGDPYHHADPQPRALPQ